MKICLKVINLLMTRTLAISDPGVVAGISDEIETHLKECATCAEFVAKFGPLNESGVVSSQRQTSNKTDGSEVDKVNVDTILNKETSNAVPSQKQTQERTDISSSGQTNVVISSSKENRTDRPADFIAKKFLLTEFFWSLLLKHVRMLIAETLATNEAKKEDIFQATENAIRYAVLPYDDLDYASINDSESLWTRLRSDSWKVVASPSAIVDGTGWFNHVKVTRSIGEVETAADGSALNFLVLCRHGLDRTTPVVVQLHRECLMNLCKIDNDLTVLTCEWPEQLSNDNALYAYVNTIAEICQHLLRDYVKQHRDTELLGIEERIWAEARVQSQDSTLSAILRYFCSEFSGHLGGDFAAWIFMPFPRCSDSLQVVAGSEPYPSPLFNPISVKPQDEACWGLVGRAWVRNRMEISRDARNDPRVIDAEKEGVFQCIAVPLLLRRHRFPLIGGVSSSGISEPAESSLGMCKLGVLYFGSRCRETNLQPHSILLIRHLGQILSGLVASVVFSEYARAGIVDDLFATSKILLDWIDPDQDWYARSGRNPMHKFINRQFPHLSRPVSTQLRLIKDKDMLSDLDRFATDKIFFIVVRMNELEDLLRPPGTDREAAGLVRTVKGLIDESFLRNEEIGRDNCIVLDFEHDLLITVANVYEAVIRRACNSFMRTYDLAVPTKRIRPIGSGRSRISIGVLPVVFQELRALGFRPIDTKDPLSSEELQDAALKNLKSKLGGVRRWLEQVKPLLPMVHDGEACSYREIGMFEKATQPPSAESAKTKVSK